MHAAPSRYYLGLVLSSGYIGLRPTKESGEGIRQRRTRRAPNIDSLSPAAAAAGPPSIKSNSSTVIGKAVNRPNIVCFERVHPVTPKIHARGRYLSQVQLSPASSGLSISITSKITP
jgi:hypothetical protein